MSPIPALSPARRGINVALVHTGSGRVRAFEVDDVKWASAIAEGERLDFVVREAVDTAMRSLEGARADLLVAFVSAHFADEYDRVPALVHDGVGGGLLLGCSAGGVIGGGSEIEDRPAFSLTVASLPGVDIAPVYVDPQAIPELGDRSGWESLLRCAPNDAPSVVLLPDPFSVPVDRVLQGLDSRFPDSRKVGGLASGARRVGGNRLYLGLNSYSAGAVGVALTGNVVVDSVVAQGCRPIGDPMFVTACRENLLMGLDGRPPLDVLRDLYERLPAADRDVFRHSLFLGLGMNDRRESYGHGDFLVRNLVGVSEEPRGLVIGASLRENLVVQFHLRDRRTSTEDLETMLRRYAAETKSRPPAGSLLFSCLGRGVHLYGEPDHDSGVFRKHVGDVPLGGFFCNGEIGPVQGRTFLHGYTSAFAMFRPRSDA
jgi:small ligand-binding sensory domain FIST